MKITRFGPPVPILYGTLGHDTGEIAEDAPDPVDRVAEAGVVQVPAMIDGPYDGTDWTESGAYGATVTAYQNSGQTPTSPDNLVDGTTADTYYPPDVMTGTFYRGWQIDLGSILEVWSIVESHTTIPNTRSGRPDDLQYSTDGSSWTTVSAAFTAESPESWDPSGGDPYIWQPVSPVSARYLRVYETFVSNDYHYGCSLRELLVRSSSLALRWVSGDLAADGDDTTYESVPVPAP